MKLYEISSMYNDFMQALEAGEIPEEAIDDTLEGLDGLLEEKVDNIACIVKTVQAEAAAIKAEEAALAERRKAKEKEADRLCAYVSNAMLDADKLKIETARNKLSFRKSTRVIVDDSFMAGLTAEQYKQFVRVPKPPEPYPIKNEIAAALKSGIELPGARLEENMSLQIK